MEFIVFALVVAILFILLSLKSDLTDKIRSLDFHIQQLKKQIEEVAKSQLSNNSISSDKQFKETPVEPVKQTKSDYWESGFKVVVEPEEIKPIDLINISSTDTLGIYEEDSVESVNEIKPEPIAVPVINRPSFANKNVPKKEKPDFFERNPDLEKFIGENLISKIGIAILVLAIAYFVKFAIDNNWIGVVGRVGIGLLCGAILTGAAHKLQNSYKAFSSVLIGGGLAVFYFTITLAYQQFHLFNQTTAFIIMVIITAFAVCLSLLYDRQEVAIIALVGGFASPFMASNGSGDYKTLFIYLIILNCALLAIAFKKGWRILNLLAFAFTIILYNSWLFYSLDYNTPAATYKGGFVFATIFYLLFFSINLLHNIKENKKFLASDFAILLANTALYFGIGLYLLDKMDAVSLKGLFCILLAVMNLIITYTLFKNKKVDTNILYLLIGITLTFISLTAPIQLHGHYITLFWASETVLLYWLYLKSRITFIQWTSMIIWVAMTFSLLMDWQNTYAYTVNAVTILFNKGFIAGLYCSAATFFLYALCRKESVALEKNLEWGYHQYKSVVLITGTVLLFITGLFEIGYQFEHYYPNEGIAILYSLAYINLFILIISTQKTTLSQLENFEQIKPYLYIVGIVMYLICVFRIYPIQEALLEARIHVIHFAIHWVSALIVGIFLFKIIKLLRTISGVKDEDMNVFIWLVCGVIVLFLSVEINFLVNLVFYSKNNTLADVSRVYIKTGLPILWGICSFVFMWFGMKFKYKKLRIISLSLFLVTLLKLFIFDLSNIPVAGKIAAFFCLGVLLLVVSFMYQRLKKIIIEDENKTVE